MTRVVSPLLPCTPAPLRFCIVVALLWLVGCGGLKLPVSGIVLPTVQVTGTVIERQLLEDKPIQGAWVVINGSLPTFTDKDGRFIVKAPIPTKDQQSVRVYLSVAKHGYFALVEQVQINTDAPTELTEPIILTPAPKEKDIIKSSSVKGRVVDKVTGRGIPDAEVLLIIEVGLHLRIRTAADGSFLLSGIFPPDKGYEFRVRASEYLSILDLRTGEIGRTVFIRLGDETVNPHVVLELFPLGSPATVKGSIVSAETLLPVANATVFIGGKQSVTGADGNFSIPEAPTGTQTVRVEHPEFELFIDTITIVGEPLLFFLNPPGSLPFLPFTLAGKVTLQGETNHSSVRVEVKRKSDGQVVDVAMTNIEGNYALWIPPGSYLVRASMYGFQPVEQEVTVRPGVAVSDVNFTLMRAP